jgi:hypothetical protein
MKYKVQVSNKSYWDVEASDESTAMFMASDAVLGQETSNCRRIAGVPPKLIVETLTDAEMEAVMGARNNESDPRAWLLAQAIKSE